MTMQHQRRVLAMRPGMAGYEPLLRPGAVRRAPGLIPRGAPLFHLFLKSVPYVWCLGILTPLAALMLIRMAAERWPRGMLINLVVFSWFAIGASQFVAAFLNGIALDNIGKGLASCLGFGVTGWIFGGLAIAVGAAHGLGGARSVRATTWLGGYILILATIAAVARMAGLHALYLAPTPAQLFLPKSPSVQFYASTLVFQTEETLGEASTRLILFFPWATGLGLGGLAIAFISTLERDFRWRLIGFAGGAVGVVFSWSRIAIATLVGVGAILAFFRLPRLWRLAVAGLLLVMLFVLALDGINPFAQVSDARSVANQARAGSSLARDLIYQKSWEAFLQSPIIGYGWVGESVHRIETLPIGSHSTIYGLLYTGGLPTFLAFAVAMLITFVAILWRVLTCDSGASSRRNELLVGLGLVLCLAAYCPYEALYNLTLPCLFLFTWIGGCLDVRRHSGGVFALSPRDNGRAAPWRVLSLKASARSGLALAPHSLHDEEITQ